MNRILSDILARFRNPALITQAKGERTQANDALNLKHPTTEYNKQDDDTEITPTNNWASLDASLILIEKKNHSLLPGSHLISPRTFYIHHGIYLGEGKVAHYSGLSSAFRAGPIEITDMVHFANGRTVWACEDHPAFSNEEIVTRARSRVGESKYRILSNNCEHFCNWCINGTSYSSQAYDFMHYPLQVLARIIGSKTCFPA